LSVLALPEAPRLERLTWELLLLEKVKGEGELTGEVGEEGLREPEEEEVSDSVEPPSPLSMEPLSRERSAGVGAAEGEEEEEVVVVE
jgi:hypothetical protein